MNRFALGLLLPWLLLCVDARLAGGTAFLPEREDLLGRWEGTAQTPDGPVSLTVVFEQADGVFTGKAVADQRTVILSDITLTADGTLTYRAHVPQQGVEEIIPFSGTVANGQMTGKYVRSSGQSIAFSARRSGTGATTESDVIIGRWSVVAEYQGAEYPITFEFRKSGTALAGYYMPGNENQEVIDLRYAGGALSFSFTHPEGGVVHLTATVTGSTLSGKLSGSFGQAPITGKKE